MSFSVNFGICESSVEYCLILMSHGLFVNCEKFVEISRFKNASQLTLDVISKDSGVPNI